MELGQLRCFVCVAEELHFGRAAQKLDMLPASLGRHIRLLEEFLGAKLVLRTTRNVGLTTDGAMLLPEARQLVEKADALVARFRASGGDGEKVVRIGAIDSAAAGLLPMLLHDLRVLHPSIATQLIEDKTIRLIPRLLSGRIDLAFIRPPDIIDSHIKTQRLFHETAVVAVSVNHRLAKRESLRIRELADEPLIVPERRSRPHSHDLTIKLFTEAGLQARIAQLADEKQTIVNLVAAEIGIAIVPQWTSRLAVSGVCFIPLTVEPGTMISKLPLSVAWLKNARDPARDAIMEVLNANLARYETFA
ncbi:MULTISPECIES: LysR family transcriptional regulator [Rhizobium/Agrobacterium group]|uniref:LysR family transcriptional regulator n=1 Tax=Rhizobium/Agrobacterium group TaxID=227290 RepID=UPI0010CBA56F|nr:MULTISPECIES: LysR family transcriptional regulator [Rhizobium/Agrobacterium group]MCZ4072518.1 LysR family transcriptional regulator [Agrobacterium sp. LMR679]NTB99340.1 LysR family transcriptional regulator [Agrobacterium tumefaciens]NTC44682.1 LysR family transcriptional regulator [Agrobacterium tumefaciens]TKV72263.1 LysR family transcriptional regulator [Rhizobium sp. AU243]